MNNRRKEKPPAWVGWVGNMGNVTDFMLSKSWLSPWCIAKALDAFFRAVGVVAFANNPLTGIIVVIAMFISNANVAWGTLLAGLVMVVFSKILKQPEGLIADGVTGFNAVLVGCISVAAFPSITGHDLGAGFWLFLTFGLIMTMYVDRGLNAMMAPSGIPALSVPFNVAGTILLLSMRNSQGYVGTEVPEIVSVPDENVTADANVTEVIEGMEGTEDIDWSKVFEGTLLAAGQIYGVGTVDASILVYLAFFIFSPLMTTFFYIGSIIGTIVGALISTAPYTEVYIGLWGYNALLTCGGLTFFLIPSPQVFLASILGAVMTAMFQATTVHIFGPMTVPALSYPFNVITLMILAISTVPDSPYIWVANKSFPEKHAVIHYLKIWGGEQQGNSIANQNHEEPLRGVTEDE